MSRLGRATINPLSGRWPPRAQVPEPSAARAASFARVGLGACLLFAAGNLLLQALNWDTPHVGLGGVLEIATAVAYAGLGVAGAVMLRRRPDNLAGAVFLVAALLLEASAFASEYGTYAVLTDPGALPAARLVTWAGAWGWWAGAGLGLTFGLMLYPDGTLPSPRWRGVAAAAAANLVLLTLLHALAPGPLDGEFSVVVNPFGVGSGTGLRSLRDAAWLLLTVNTLLALAALVTRVRRATAEQRRQLQWLLIPGVTAVVAAPLWGLSAGDEGDPSTASQMFVLAAVFGTPAAVALAIGSAARLHRSLERVVLAREEERRRIRRDLHDGLGPTLAGVALQLDVARRLVPSDPSRAEAVLGGVVGQIKGAIGDIRRLVDDLRPPVLDQLGLVSSIKEGTAYLARRDETGGLTLTVEAGGNLGSLPPATEVTAFRIVMEAVTNASRHAQASHCRVYLAAGRALEVRVEDDGQGVPADHVPGVGLASMCERAGELGGTCVVEPRPGGGTIVRASLPIGPS